MNNSRRPSIPRRLSFACAVALGLTATSGSLVLAAEPPDPARAQALRAEVAELRAQMVEDGRRLAKLSAELGEQQVEETNNVEVAVFRAGSDRPMLGLLLSVEGDAVVIGDVVPGSAIADAGVEAGDRLIAIDGKALPNVDARTRAASASAELQNLEVDQTVRLGIERDGRPMTIEAKAKPMPAMTRYVRKVGGQPVQVSVFTADASAPIGDPFEWDRIAPFAGCADGEDCTHRIMKAMRWGGLELSDIGPELGRYFGTDRGVLVLAADDRSMPGLAPGDVLLSVDGKPIEHSSELMRELRGRDEGESIRLSLLRDGKNVDVEVTAPALARAFEFMPPPPPAPPAPPAPPQPNQVPAAPAAPAPPAPPPKPARDPGMV